MKKIFGLLLLIIVLASSCRDDAETKINDQSLIGDWLYVEYGFSPGAGYITKAVPAIPPLAISFEKDFRLSTNLEGLEKYKFYRVIEDSQHSTSVIAFYEEDPGSLPQDISNLTHSYTLNWQDNTLKLSYRWCDEGCHMRFRKIGTREEH